MDDFYSPRDQKSNEWPSQVQLATLTSEQVEKDDIRFGAFFEGGLDDIVLFSSLGASPKFGYGRGEPKVSNTCSMQNVRSIEIGSHDRNGWIVKLDFKDADGKSILMSKSVNTSPQKTEKFNL